MNSNPLSDRIEQLLALAADDSDGDVVVASNNLVGLRDELAALRADLLAFRSEVGTLRTEIDAVSGRVTSAVAATRSETSGLARRVADLGTVLDGVGSRVEQLGSDLPGIRGDLRAALAQVPAQDEARLDAATERLAATVGARVEGLAAEIQRAVAAALSRDSEQATATYTLLTDARTTVEARMAVLEDTLEALAERQEAATRDGVQSVVEQVRVVLGEAGGPLDTGQLAKAVATELATALREQQRQLHTDLFDQLDRAAAQQEATRNQVIAFLESAKREGSQRSQAISALDARLPELLARLREDVAVDGEDVAAQVLAAVSSTLRRQEEVLAQLKALPTAADLAALTRALDGPRAKAPAKRASVGSVPEVPSPATALAAASEGPRTPLHPPRD